MTKIGESISAKVAPPSEEVTITSSVSCANPVLRNANNKIINIFHNSLLWKLKIKS